VEANGRIVEVPEGMVSEIKRGMPPSQPVRQPPVGGKDKK